MTTVLPTETLRRKPESLRAAINAKCFDCIYDPANGPPGTWRRQIAACPIKTCALWPFRAKSNSARVNPNESEDESND